MTTLLELVDLIAGKYGFAVAVVVVVCASAAASFGFLIWKILDWTRAQIERMLADAERREQVLMGLCDAQRRALEAHTESSKQFHDDVSKAHAYQQLEHQSQIKALDVITNRLLAVAK